MLWPSWPWAMFDKPCPSCEAPVNVPALNGAPAVCPARGSRFWVYRVHSLAQPGVPDDWLLEDMDLPPAGSLERAMREREHTHLWRVEHAEEPAYSTLRCELCGRVVEPARFFALRDENAELRVIVDALANEGRYQSESGEGSMAYLARLVERARAWLAEHPPS